MPGLWKYINQICAIILSLSGTILLPVQIYAISKSMEITIIASITLILVIGWGALTYFFTTATQFRSGYGRFPTKSVVTHRISNIHVDTHFIATIQRQIDVIFFEEPQKDDLVDMIDSLPDETIQERHYHSDDSTIADISHRLNNVLVVYWRPKDKISPFVPYRHSHTHISPSLYGEDYFYHSIYFDRNVGVSELIITTGNKIESAIAFLLPARLGQVTERRLYKYGKVRNRRGCEQPILNESRDKVRWTINNPIKGRVYVLVVIYQGYEAKFMGKVKEQSFRYRLKAIMSSLYRLSLQRSSTDLPKDPRY